MEITNPLIRPMTLSDLDSVLRIEEKSFSQPWTREQFMTEIGRGTVSRCYVAVRQKDKDEDEGILGAVSGPELLTGFIMAWLVSDELHITNLAVAPETRRRGVAAALLDYSIKEAVEDGAVWCQLEVRISNTPARKLYSRFGFRDLGVRKGYYQNGEDAVVMGKDLPTQR